MLLPSFAQNQAFFRSLFSRADKNHPLVFQIVYPAKPRSSALPEPASRNPLSDAEGSLKFPSQLCSQKRGPESQRCPIVMSSL
jgi:hypothetical protein